MATLGQAYVQIVPSADGISNSISSVLSGPADKAGQDAGSTRSERPQVWRSAKAFPM